MNNPELLNSLTLPLHGNRLIEASAGTGKTFTIGIIYLRLLLGLGGENAYSRPLSVEEILVVTFTESATAELRGRIRENIHELRIACVRGSGGGPILAQIDDLSQAASLLLAAERQMDEAAIFTIHGFCQRMLNLHAFESGLLFKQELIEDETPLFKQATADFWRRHCYPLTLDMARAIITEWDGPESLLSTLRPLLQGNAPLLKNPPAANETLAARHLANLDHIAVLKQKWRADSNTIKEIISRSGIDKRTYNSKYLPIWVAKITQWANSKTVDYLFPIELKRFAQCVLVQKTKEGSPPLHPLFQAVETFLALSLSLRDVVIAKALVEVREAVHKEKRQRALLGFDDLLSRMDEALQKPGGALLADTIRNRFPVALIDEFQDTDPQQYSIFRKLYLNQPELLLLLIGDPKQAIYAFRGADIFTYLRARREISAHYTLYTNWRSTPGMVQSVNHLFSCIKSPFLFSAIPFLPVNSAVSNQHLRLLKDSQSQAALRFWLQPGDGVSVSDYQQFMSQQCAADISRWLVAGQKGRAFLGKCENLRPVYASDITVLVRSRNEAGLIRDALNKLSIPSVYLSNRDSVYTTSEARELLWILQAVHAPEQERLLRRAMATSIFALDTTTLDRLSQNECEWDELIEQFATWQKIWRQRGVLPMMRNIMNQRNLAENMLISENGERRLTNLMHLGELLQEASMQFCSRHALLRFLTQKISRPDSQSPDQQLRLESDRHLVQIVTIHKSKGLQYPIVWLPFAAGFREVSSALYHDQQSFAPLLDVQGDKESMELAEQERLAEDLRLLYVALTRSVFHCSVGIAPLFKGIYKKKGNSDLSKSALGYLLQQGKNDDSNRLRAKLEMLVDSDTEVVIQGLIPGENWYEQPVCNHMLSSRNFTRDMRDDAWRISSYSELCQYSSTPLIEVMPTSFDTDATDRESDEVKKTLTPHDFPRGVAPGTFLHSLFESLDFTQPPDKNMLKTQLEQNGYPMHWLLVLEDWISRVLHTPLNDDGLMLGVLKNCDRLVEMEFYLPLNRKLNTADLDALLRTHDALSTRAPQLEFRQVHGMLKGFIDLIFRWKDKYYILDYKSNWLGDSQASYTSEVMAQAMIDHRYDLQYQLYTLALHRYLQHRLRRSYDYHRHFGGIFYLFLRGIEVNNLETGIFTARPSVRCVTELDELFRYSG
ncbi:exodeoxyribonuclease V subunit beta [Pantoea sp. Nvir]|uniref:exodeoxyribonuclease V subunit beta n=1 Tax=Pantoea sp. Nvir TaxID=2576760 RepID=UPI0027FB76AA|nr:exodeoxyribonuclease V subunit beta [Pantoea sp. Nvir]CAJ0993209.1 RecBCD enzyme subunit RecB [Pantoea sp. Nvir]